MKKHLLLFAYHLCLTTLAFPQMIEWQNTIGGSDGDALFSLQQTADGGYILGGKSHSPVSGDKTEGCQGSADYWLVKTDSAGTIQWQNTIGGSYEEYIYSVQQTADGGYIIGGPSGSDISGDKTENGYGGEDYWIVKTDANGNIQWQKTIGGNDWDILKVIQQTSDGGYIQGGFSNSDSSGLKTENNIGGGGNVDYWIIKTDQTGNIQWQNTLGGYSDDKLQSIEQTTDGGYILGGRSNSPSSGDKAENSIGGNDYWIIKTDSLGNKLWENTIGGSSVDILQSIHQTTDGGYILGGSSASNIGADKTENSFGGYDYWLVKTDAMGVIQWQNTIGGSDDDELNSMQQTADGGYVLAGISYSNISGYKTQNSRGNSDYWIVKTDSSGNVQWQSTIGGNAREELWSVKQAADGNYMLGGYSFSGMTGDKTEGSLGSYDYWIVKVSDKFNSISGKLFIDANSNAIQDAGELPLQYNKVTESVSLGFSFSDYTGHYTVAVYDTGNYSVSPDAISYYNAVPSVQPAYFSGINQQDSLNDFAFQPVGIFNDLCITITPMGNFRDNMNANYMINYENVGTTTLNSTVIFFPDNDVTFVSADPVATSVTTDSVVWNVGTLAPFQTGNILATIHVNAGTPIGTLVNSTVRIEPVAGDANTACNYASYPVYVTGSFDPNEILVDEDTLFTTQLTNPPYLEYIIYFQNTGNDTAFNVRVSNIFPTYELRVNTFEFVASSHPVNITYKPWERNFEFTFNNILLPDSNVNEPASHGFVRYRIKPRTTLSAGDSIENNASIYFDFNEPIMTNTAVTEIVLPTGIGGQMAEGRGQLAVYPNPAYDMLIINSYLLSGKKAEMKIYDLYGREVFQLQTSNLKPETKINVSNFSQGVYFVELRSGEQVLRKKFLKQ